MACQLIYTSSPRGLTSGRTGFVTVARHQEMSARLTGDLEKESSYEWGSGNGPHPVIRRYVLLSSGNVKYRVLSRILPAGLDFTHRACHLAHHLVANPSEPVLGTPLDWLCRWQGYYDSWKEEPRWLQEEEKVALNQPGFAVGTNPQWPSQVPGDQAFWKTLPASARARPIFIYEPGQEELLHQLWQWLLAQVSPARQWELTFTSYLQASESAERYVWCAGWPGSTAAALAKREPERLVDLTAGIVAEELQGLVLRGEGEMKPVRRLYVSSAEASQVREKVSVVRPVGRVISATYVPAESAMENSQRVNSWVWIGGALTLLVLLGVGGWWWVKDTDRTPLDSIHRSPEPAYPLSWEAFSGSTSTTAETKPVRPSVNWAERWQDVASQNSYEVVKRFAESLRTVSGGEEWQEKAARWLEEREALRSRMLQQIEGWINPSVVWNEVQWRGDLERLPVEWRPDVEKEYRLWHPVGEWLRQIPQHPVFFLMGDGNVWNCDLEPLLDGIILEETDWSVSGSWQGEEFPLQILKIDSLYQVVYDIYPIWRMQLREGRWSVRTESLPADVLRQNPALFAVNQSPVIRVRLKGSKDPLFAFSRGDDEKTIVGQSRIPLRTVLVAHGEKVQLAAWLVSALDRLRFIPSSSLETAHWELRNKRGEMLYRPHDGDRNKILPARSTTGRPNIIFTMDWMLKNTPWELRWKTDIPDENGVLLIFE